MEMVIAFFAQLLANPAVRTFIIGAVVKLVVDQLKKVAAQIDADGNKAYRVPVQFLVMVCTFIASLGDLYLKSQLHTFDPQVLINFLAVILPTYFSAMGIQNFCNWIKERLGVRNAAK